jgi:hypothetical protein
MRTLLIALAVVAPLRVAVADPNRCEIAVTGDTTLTIKAESASPQQGKLAASTDYWMSEEQIRFALSAMTGIASKLSQAELDKKVDAKMKADPRFMLLMINCMAPEGGVILGASSSSKYADVPYKPGTFRIAKDDAKAGQFTIMMHLSPGGAYERWGLSEPGTLVLGQFDGKGIAGTFTLKAETRKPPVKHATFVGTFHYACLGAACK